MTAAALGFFVRVMAQAAQVSLPVVLVDQGVRDSLARAWDDTTPHQVEQGYCVRYREEESYGHVRYRVTAFAPVDSVRHQSPYAIALYCPARTASVHTHTPATCERRFDGHVLLKTCVLGGDDAWFCQPSAEDVARLTARGDSRSCSATGGRWSRITHADPARMTDMPDHPDHPEHPEHWNDSAERPEEWTRWEDEEPGPLPWDADELDDSAWRGEVHPPAADRDGWPVASLESEGPGWPVEDAGPIYWLFKRETESETESSDEEC